MPRTFTGQMAVYALVLAATLLALAGLSSRANSTEPQTPPLALALTCPEQQGQLKRLSASSDGASCSYSIDSDKTFQIDLQRVTVDEQSPAGYKDTFSVIEYGIDKSKILETLIKYGIKLGDDYLTTDTHGNMIDFFIIKYPESNRSGYRSIGIFIKGRKLGPLVMGIFSSKDQMNDAVTEDFAALTEGATASWIKSDPPAPCHSPDRSRGCPHHR